MLQNIGFKSAITNHFGKIENSVCCVLEGQRKRSLIRVSLSASALVIGVGEGVLRWSRQEHHQLLVIMASPTFGTGAAGVLVFKGRPEDVFIKTLLAFGILAASFFGQTVKYGVVAQK